MSVQNSQAVVGYRTTQSQQMVDKSLFCLIPCLPN